MTHLGVNVIAHSHSREENAARVVGATSSDGFLLQSYSTS